MVQEKRKYADGNENSSPAKRHKLDESKMDDKDRSEPIQVQCANGRIVSLSRAASDELKRAGYRIDPDVAPLSEHDPNVSILVDHRPVCLIIIIIIMF